jgi:hypothetical protein
MDDEVATGMSASNASPELRLIIRSYRRAAWRLRHLFEGPVNDFSLSATWTTDRNQSESTFLAGSDAHRHAALLQPFLAPASSIELRSVWNRLVDAGHVDGGTMVRVEQAFATADRLDMRVEVNGRQLTARDIYFAYGEGQYFGADPEAHRILEAMSVGPMAALVPFLFHESLASLTNLVFLVLEVVLACERALVEPSGPGAEPSICIYCRTTEGDFTHDEHVVPEALGQDELVLSGCVCAVCNNELSTLDDALVGFEPLALLRTLYVPFTKEGKLPHVKLRGIEVRKVAPREIRVTCKSGQSPFEVIELDDGMVQLRFHATGRKKADPVRLARALFKIGLGLVASQAGVGAALDARYDKAREFIRSGRPLATHLLVPSRVKPEPSMRTWWLPSEAGTPVVLSLFGLLFAFDLDGGASAFPLPQPTGEMLTFWLGEAGTHPFESVA